MPETTSKDAPSSEPIVNHVLNVEKLHALPSERQDLVLLTFVSDLAQHLQSLSEDDLNDTQREHKNEVIKVVNLSSPAPTRVIRNNIGQCLRTIFQRGSRKVLFETINELIPIVNNNGRNESELRAKHAAVHCLGIVFETAGDSALSLANNALLVLQKQIKAASNLTGLRGAVVRAIGRVFKGTGRQVDETIARDIWKQLRQLVTGEKSNLVQMHTCWAVQQLFEYTTYLDNSSDFEKLQSAIWKITDSSSVPVRRAATSCISAIYVKNYAEVPLQQTVSRSKKTKKTRTLDADGDEPVSALERTDSGVSQRPALSLSFGLTDILKQLSVQYCRPSSGDRTRASIIQCYIRVVRALPDEVLETSYPSIARHFFTELLGSPAVLNNRYRLLITRKFVHTVLAKVIVLQTFGESSQLNAVKFLVNGIIKDYPQSDIKERPEPPKEMLISALGVLVTLFDALGSATAAVADICRNGLLQVLEHPSFTVQVHAAKAMKSFVLACPAQLLPCATICMNSVAREVAHLSGQRRSPRRCTGYALGLSATISTSSSQPLYGDVNVYARIMSQAMSILKSSANSDLRVSSIQIQVAYTMISGLMSLGPSFVKIHLSQLLLIWRNALPKPNNSDVPPGGRGMRELSFLSHIRECALSSIKAFLKYNGKLLTLDVSKRLASVLEYTTMFIQTLPSKQTSDDANNLLSSSLQLRDYNFMMRRRVFECYTELLRLSSVFSEENLLPTGLLSLAGTCFADADTSSATSLSSSIAISAGNFDRIWDVGDNSGFGLTSLVNGYDVDDVDPEEKWHAHWLSQSDIDTRIENIITSPTAASPEQDSVLLYAGAENSGAQPTGTAVVDAAIRLFATALPLQSSRIQEGAVEQITTLVSQNNIQKNPAREVATAINAALALMYTLQIANRETNFGAGSIRGTAIERAIQELLETFLTHREETVRSISSAAIGRLCRLAGHEFTTKAIQSLIDRIVKDRDPVVRSGCAQALGCIASSLGGMAAGLHFKDILGILNSLATDPHPTVHFWAIDGITKIAESAGISFSSYVTGALGMIGGLYVAESHGDECATLSYSNQELDCPSFAVLARCVNAMIDVLGPDLQELPKPRKLVLTLTHQFGLEESPLATVAALKCLQNLSLYATGHISFTPYVKMLQSKIDSSNPQIQAVALEGLNNAMRVGAEDVLSIEPYLGDQIWQVLNEAYGQGPSRIIVKDWAEQSGLSMIGTWIERIAHVFTVVKASKKKVVPAESAKPAPVHEAQDEEVAGFAASAVDTVKDAPADPSDTSQDLLRWQTRAQALQLLNDILLAARKNAAADEHSSAIQLLQPRVAEIVKIAFSASTAVVVELRIQGIRIIGQVLQIFGRIPDPDFPEVTMLEQYQAQISSALTPAFASDSSPVLAAEAVDVCGSFISTGIVTDKDRMGRILRLLVSALEDFSKEAEAVSIGDLKGLSANAQVMVRLAVFSAWADLQVASQEQAYLEDVLRPYAAKLTPLWLSSLREYARLKFEPEISMAGVVPTGGLDEVYASLNREVLLDFYQASWLNFVNAIASLIEEDADFVFDALDGKDGTHVNGNASSRKTEISYRDEPVAFFFVLFGIAFEALIARSSGDAISAGQKKLEVLQAVKRILRPSIAGVAIYQDAIFNEAMELLDRLGLTEGLEVQSVIIEIARNLCSEHPSARRSTEESELPAHELSDDIEQLFELTRIIVLILAQHVPALSPEKPASGGAPSEEVIALIISSLTALVASAEVFPSIIKSDLHSCIFHVFAAIFSTPSFQNEVVPQALPVFKRFITGLAESSQSDMTSQVRNAMARFLGLIKSAQSREAEAAVQCEKNTLLASAILVSSTIDYFVKDDPLLTRFIDTVVDCMGNLLTAKVAAGVARSLLMLSSNSDNDNAADVVKSILPQLIAFLLLPCEADGLEQIKPVVSQSLAAFAMASNTASQQAMTNLVVVTLLKRASAEGQKVWPEVGARLMELASKGPDCFRISMANMSVDQRSLTQQIVQRSGLAARQSSNVGEQDLSSREPTIALKMSF